MVVFVTSEWKRKQFQVPISRKYLHFTCSGLEILWLIFYFISKYVLINIENILMNMCESLNVNCFGDTLCPR